MGVGHDHDGRVASSPERVPASRRSGGGVAGVRTPSASEAGGGRQADGVRTPATPPPLLLTRRSPSHDSGPHPARLALEGFSDREANGMAGTGEADPLASTAIPGSAADATTQTR